MTESTWTHDLDSIIDANYRKIKHSTPKSEIDSARSSIDLGRTKDTIGLTLRLQV